MKPRFSPSCDRSCVKMADRFAPRRYSLKNRLVLSCDKTIIELGYRKISWFFSVSQINISSNYAFILILQLALSLWNRFLLNQSIGSQLREGEKYYCCCWKNELQKAADRCLFHSVHAHGSEDFNSKREARKAQLDFWVYKSGYGSR